MVFSCVDIISLIQLPFSFSHTIRKINLRGWLFKYIAKPPMPFRLLHIFFAFGIEVIFRWWLASFGLLTFPFHTDRQFVFWLEFIACARFACFHITYQMCVEQYMSVFGGRILFGYIFIIIITWCNLCSQFDQRSHRHSTMGWQLVFATWTR